MSVDQCDPAAPGGTSATAHVVRGGNREVEVAVGLACPHPDGQIRYELTARARLVIPAGDPLPVFCLLGTPTVTLVAPPAPQPVYTVRAHSVCRDTDGRVRWEADTEPVVLPPGAPLPPELAFATTVAHAAGRPYQEDYDGGH